MSLRNRFRSSLVLGAAALSVLALAACGGGVQESSGGSGGAAASTGPKSAEAAAAQKVLDQYKNTPTTITQTEALPSAPPKGKTMVWLNCDIQTCTAQGAGLKAAAEAAGWTYEQINYQSANPATLTAAFNRALAMKPTVVIESGVPPQAGQMPWWLHHSQPRLRLGRKSPLSPARSTAVQMASRVRSKRRSSSSDISS